MSYCETHLEAEERISASKKHKLIHPVENLGSRMRKMNDEPLELFCRVEQMFVCKSCKDSDHKTHTIVRLEEEAQMRKAQLAIDRKDMDQMMQTRQQKIHEIQHSVEASRNNAVKALSYSTRVMAAVADYIKRSQAELAEVIQMQQKKTETETEGFIKELEGEIMQIRRNNLQLNQVSLSNDGVIFLQDFLSLTIPPPQVKDWSGVTIKCDQFAVQGALTNLETTVVREIRMLRDPDLDRNAAA